MIGRKENFRSFPLQAFLSQSLLLFPLNAHNTFNTCIYHHLPPTCSGVCYTIFRVTIMLLAQKLYALCNVTTKCTIYPFLIYNAVTMLLQCTKPHFVLLYLKNLKMLVKIIDCSTIIFVGSWYTVYYVCWQYTCSLYPAVIGSVMAQKS